MKRDDKKSHRGQSLLPDKYILWRTRALVKQNALEAARLEKMIDAYLGELAYLMNERGRIGFHRKVSAQVLWLLHKLETVTETGRKNAASLDEHIACLRLSVTGLIFKFQEAEAELEETKTQLEETERDLDVARENLMIKEEELKAIRGCR